LIVPLVGGEESTHRLLVLATQKLSPATNQTQKMKTDNWLLRESTTRVTDNRTWWREEYEEYLANKDASTLSDYLELYAPSKPIRWWWVYAKVVDIVNIAALIVFASLAYVIIKTAKHIF